MNDLGLGDPNSPVGGPTQPIHITTKDSPNWSDRTQLLEESIHTGHTFEGRYQTYVDDYHKIILPDNLIPLLKDGGVITKSTDRHLLLFGKKHWEWYKRKTAEQIGIQPLHNNAARHILESYTKFDQIYPDGTIAIPSDLQNYGGLLKDIVIVGLLFYAELHDKTTYELQAKDKAVRERLDEFRQTRFN